MFTKRGYKKWLPTFNSNWVSRLFWFGAAEGGIQKNAKHIFLKEAKAAAFQLRIPIAIGTAVEANFATCKTP